MQIPINLTVMKPALKNRGKKAPFHVLKKPNDSFTKWL